MRSLTQVIVEKFCRKLEPICVLDVGFIDSDYIGFLFAYVGAVGAIDFRYFDELHPYMGMIRQARCANFRYVTTEFGDAEVVICTNYLARCGIEYDSSPLHPLDEQRAIFTKMLEKARKGVIVTVPAASLPEGSHIQPEGYIYDKYAMRLLLDTLSNVRYNVDITYYKGNDVISPQQAQELVYPSIATCAIEVIKARY